MARRKRTDTSHTPKKHSAILKKSITKHKKDASPLQNFYKTRLRSKDRQSPEKVYSTKQNVQKALTRLEGMYTRQKKTETSSLKNISKRVSETEDVGPVDEQTEDSSVSRRPNRSKKKQEAFDPRKVHVTNTSESASASKNDLPKEFCNPERTYPTRSKKVEAATSQLRKSPRKTSRSMWTPENEDPQDFASPWKSNSTRETKLRAVTSVKQHSSIKTSKRLTTPEEQPEDSSPPKMNVTRQNKKVALTSKVMQLSRKALERASESEKSFSASEQPEECASPQKLPSVKNLQVVLQKNTQPHSHNPLEDLTPPDFSSSSGAEMEQVLNRQSSSFVDLPKLTGTKKSLEAFLTDRSTLSQNSVPHEPLWWKSLDKILDDSSQGAVSSDYRIRINREAAFPLDAHRSSGPAALPRSSLETKSVFNVGEKYSTLQYLLDDNEKENEQLHTSHKRNSYRMNKMFNSRFSETSKTSTEDSIIAKPPLNKHRIRKPKHVRLVQDDLFDAVFQQTSNFSSYTDIAEELRVPPAHKHTILSANDKSSTDGHDTDTSTPSKRRNVFKKLRQKKTGNDDQFEAVLENCGTGSPNKQHSTLLQVEKCVDVSVSKQSSFSLDSDILDSDLDVAVPPTKRRFYKPRLNKHIEDNIFDAAFETSSNTIENFKNIIHTPVQEITEYRLGKPAVVKEDGHFESAMSPKRTSAFKKPRRRKTKNNDASNSAFEHYDSADVSEEQTNFVQQGERDAVTTTGDSMDSDDVTLARRYILRKSASKRLNEDDIFYAAFERSNNTTNEKQSSATKIAHSSARKPMLDSSKNIQDSVSSDTTTLSPVKFHAFKKHRQQKKKTDEHFDVAFEKSDTEDAKQTLLNSVHIDDHIKDTSSYSKGSDSTPAKRHSLWKSKSKRDDDDLFLAAFEKSNNTANEKISSEIKNAASSSGKPMSESSESAENSEESSGIIAPSLKLLTIKKHQQRKTKSDDNFDVAFEKSKTDNASREVSGSVLKHEKQVTIAASSDSNDGDVTPTRMRVLGKSLSKRYNDDDLFHAAFEKSNTTAGEKSSSISKMTVSSSRKTALQTSGSVRVSEAFHTSLTTTESNTFKKRQQLKVKSDGHFDAAFKKSDTSDKNEKHSNSVHQNDKVVVSTASDSEGSNDVTPSRRCVLRKPKSKRDADDDLFHAAFERSNTTAGEKLSDTAKLTESSSRKPALQTSGSVRGSEAFHTSVTPPKSNTFKKRQQLKVKSDGYFDAAFEKSDTSDTNDKHSNSVHQNDKVVVSTASDSEGSNDVTPSRRCVLRKPKSKRDADDDLFHAAFERSNSTAGEKLSDTAKLTESSSRKPALQTSGSVRVSEEFHTSVTPPKSNTFKKRQQLKVKSDGHFDAAFEKSDTSDKNEKHSNSVHQNDKVVVSTASDSEGSNDVTSSRRSVLRKPKSKRDADDDLFHAAFERSNTTAGEKSSSISKMTVSSSRKTALQTSGSVRVSEAFSTSVMPPKNINNLKKRQQVKVKSDGNFDAAFEKSDTSDTNDKHSNSVHQNDKVVVSTASDSEGSNDVTPSRRRVLRKPKSKRDADDDLFHAAFERSNSTAGEKLSDAAKLTESSSRKPALQTSGSVRVSEEFHTSVTPPKSNTFKKRQQLKVKSDGHFDAAFEKSDTSDKNEKHSNSVHQNDKVVVSTASDSEGSNDVTPSRRRVLRKPKSKRDADDDLFHAAFERSNTTAGEKSSISKMTVSSSRKTALQTSGSVRGSVEFDNSFAIPKNIHTFKKHKQRKPRHEDDEYDAAFENFDTGGANRAPTNSVHQNGDQVKVAAISGTAASDDVFHAAFESSSNATDGQLSKSKAANSSFHNPLLESSGAVQSSEEFHSTTTRHKQLHSFDRQQQRNRSYEESVAASENLNSVGGSKKPSDVLKLNEQQVTVDAGHNSDVDGGGDIYATDEFSDKFRSKQAHNSNLLNAAFDRSYSNENDKGLVEVKEVNNADVSSREHLSVSSILSRQQEKTSDGRSVVSVENSSVTVLPSIRAKSKLDKELRTVGNQHSTLSHSSVGYDGDASHKLSKKHLDRKRDSCGQVVTAFMSPNVSGTDKSVSTSAQQTKTPVSSVSKRGVSAHITDDSEAGNDVTSTARHILQESRKISNNDFETAENPTSPIGEMSAEMHTDDISPKNRKPNFDTNSVRALQAVTPPKKRLAVKKRQRTTNEGGDNEFDAAFAESSNSVTSEVSQDQVSTSNSLSSSARLKIVEVTLHENVSQKQVNLVNRSELSDKKVTSPELSLHDSRQAHSDVVSHETESADGFHRSAVGRRIGSPVVGNFLKVCDELGETSGSTLGKELRPEKIPEPESKQTSHRKVSKSLASAAKHVQKTDGNDDGSGNVKEMVNNNNTFSGKLRESITANSVATSRQRKITDFIEAYRKKKAEKKIELNRIREIPLSCDLPDPVACEKVTNKRVKEIDVDADFLVDGKVYKSRRLKKPAPWFSKQLYCVFIQACQLKYGALRHRNIAEKRGCELSMHVKKVVQMKKKYEPVVEDIKKMLFNLGVIETLDDFYHFTREYLPEEFRYKVIPCVKAYGQMTGIPIPEDCDPWARLSFD